MPWCPKCGTEYRDDFIICSDCGADLVEKPELPAGEAEPRYDKEAFLVSVANSIEADMLEALLKDNSIPVLKKYREAGDILQIYMGGTSFGVDLYVPGQLLEKAREILENTQTPVEDRKISDDADELTENGLSKGAPVEEELSDGVGAEELPVEGPSIKESLEAALPGEKTAEGKPEEDGVEQHFSRKRRIYTWIILLLFVPGIIWIIVALIYNLYQWLTSK